MMYTPRRNIQRKQEPIPMRSVEDPKETFELELDGVLVNRQTRPPAIAAYVIQMFLEFHGVKAKAYYIRQSKMNFKPLTDEYRY